MIPNNDPLDIIGSLDLLTRYLYDRVPDHIHKSTIYKQVFKNDPKIPFDALLAHLEDENFIHHPLESVNGEEVEKTDYYSLKPSGIFFYQWSDIPGRPFYAKEVARINDLQKAEVMAKVVQRESYLKRNWMVLPFITFLLGMLSTLGTEFLKRKIWPDPKSTNQIAIIRDTLRVHDTLQAPSSRP